MQRSRLPCVLACALLACGDSGIESSTDELAGHPDAIDIGFNGGPDQFAYYDEFLKTSTVPQKGPRICHTYPSWDVALQAPGHGSTALPGSRAWLEDWLAHAEGHCDEALISFKSYPKSEGGSGHEAPAMTSAPSVAEYTKAATAFVTTKWPKWTGKFAFTPWNEPNNGAKSGDGLGKELSPSEAAEYYLALRHLCGKHSCKVAAGDLASNGTMVADFHFNCPSDIVAPKDLCKEASWLDRYKNYLANHANDAPYKLGAGFRPEVFAFHPWYDVNDYVNSKTHCNTTEHCSTRALLENLGGSWSHVEIWDTEIGVGQDGEAALSDARQACGAAFLIRLTANLSARITRIYYTRMRGGNPALFTGTTSARPAMKVLADRETQYTKTSCF